MNEARLRRCREIAGELVSLAEEIEADVTIHGERGLLGFYRNPGCDGGEAAIETLQTISHHAYETGQLLDGLLGEGD